MKARWERRGVAPSSWLVAHEGGVYGLEPGALLAGYDAEGKRASERRVPSLGGGEAPSRFGRVDDAWLFHSTGAPHFTKLGRGKPVPFAEGHAEIVAFDVAADGVAVARGGDAPALELHSHGDKRRWSVAAGPFLSVTLAGGAMAALAEDGVLTFLSCKDGTVQGTLHLASTEPASGWRIGHLGKGMLALSLGDWVVFVDAASRKVQRRVRMSGKVIALAADARGVTVALESGHLQSAHPESPEAAEGFPAEDTGIQALALGKDAIFVAGASGAVRAFDRTPFAPPAVTAPITAIACRGGLVAVGNRAGAVRVLQGEREVATCSVGEEVTSVYLTKGEILVAASARLVVSAKRPWTKLRPVALRSPPSAFAADDAYAFAGTTTGSVDVYDLELGELVTSYALTDGGIAALTRLPGKLLVVGTDSLDGRVLIVDVEDAKVLHRVSPHEDAFGVTCLAVDPRGRIVASGGDDGIVALIDPAKGRLLAKLRVRETPASLAFDATGKRLACAFADGTAALVTLGPKGASLEDVAVRGARKVVWGDQAIFGLEGGELTSVSLDA